MTCDIYYIRTFHTVSGNANLQMHCFLMELESVLIAEGKLPDIIYHQIDGGSENTAKCVLALCELLVARRLCKKFVLTRLKPGHTHEVIYILYAACFFLIDLNYFFVLLSLYRTSIRNSRWYGKEFGLNLYTHLKNIKQLLRAHWVRKHMSVKCLIYLLCLITRHYWTSLSTKNFQCNSIVHYNKIYYANI